MFAHGKVEKMDGMIRNKPIAGTPPENGEICNTTNWRINLFGSKISRQLSLINKRTVVVTNLNCTIAKDATNV